MCEAHASDNIRRTASLRLRRVRGSREERQKRGRSVCTATSADREECEKYLRPVCVRSIRLLIPELQHSSALRPSDPASVPAALLCAVTVLSKIGGWRKLIQEQASIQSQRSSEPTSGLER